MKTSREVPHNRAEQNNIHIQTHTAHTGITHQSKPKHSTTRQTKAEQHTAPKTTAKEAQSRA